MKIDYGASKCFVFFFYKSHVIITAMDMGHYSIVSGA